MCSGSSDTSAAWKTRETETAHHELHRATRHGHLPAEDEHGVHTPCAISLSGLGVDLADHLGDHLVANRSRRRLTLFSTCRTPTPTRPRCGTSVQPGGRRSRSVRRPPAAFGSVCAFSNSFVRRVISSSVPSFRIRLRAADSSANPLVDVPAHTPRSIWFWFRQL